MGVLNPDAVATLNKLKSNLDSKQFPAVSLAAAHALLHGDNRATLELYKRRRDILSVYIEGGPATTSAFLVENTIDVIQLHISPMIIGLGISSFLQPAIRRVADSVRFDSHVYRTVGDGMMFVGRAAS